MGACVHNKRGKNGGLLKKPTKWWCTHDRFAEVLGVWCRGDHEHEWVHGSNTKDSEVYTVELADEICYALQEIIAETHYAYYVEDGLADKPYRLREDDQDGHLVYYLDVNRERAEVERNFRFSAQALCSTAVWGDEGHGRHRVL